MQGLMWLAILPSGQLAGEREEMKNLAKGVCLGWACILKNIFILSFNFMNVLASFPSALIDIFVLLNLSLPMGSSIEKLPNVDPTTTAIFSFLTLRSCICWIK